MDTTEHTASSADPKANAIEKAIQILLAFLPSNEPIGTTELSRRLGLHKATTSRILQTLAQYDFLYQDPDSKKFTLGNVALRMGHAVSQSVRHGMVGLLRPHLANLRDRTGFTASLEVWYGHQAVTTCVLETSPPLAAFVGVGEVIPWNVAAGVRAILAYSPDEVRERFLNRPMPSFTANSTTDADDFLERLEETRMRGFSVEQGEFFPNLTAMAAPVYSHESPYPVGAVVLAGPSDELSPESSRVAEALTQTAASCSEALFQAFSGPKALTYPRVHADPLKRGPHGR